jgi:hypothetical protein
MKTGDLVLDYLLDHLDIHQSGDDFDTWMERCRTQHVGAYLDREFPVA